MVVEQTFDSLHAGLWEYFKSSRYSDATIHSGDQKFKVHKESADSTIELKEDEVSVVEAMLQFMYRFDYDAGYNDKAPVSPMIFHIKVYSIADKYDVLMLKSRAREKFEVLVKTCWDMDDFPYTIAEIYSSTHETDRGLRDLVVKIACAQINALLEKQGFQTVLEETVGFAADVTRFMAKKYAPTVTDLDFSW